ncbi:MAG: hypothetical protein KDJ52_28220, partial [Anaerolineae bacterium]|nr:hypothetical protein [Anaerolineae bacterium]
MPTQDATNSPALIIDRALALAKEIVTTCNDVLETTPSTQASFMHYRPHTLTESHQHGMAVAQTLAEWNAEPELQVAGLLHSFVYKGLLSVEKVAAVCNERTAFLCEQYCDILTQPAETQYHGKPGVLRRVKLFMAAYCDPALAFLGVASLWDHFVLARQSETS